MSAPTPVAETYIPCYQLAASIGAASAAITGGGFSVPVKTDDMSNNAGYGYYEDVQTLKMASIKVTIAAKTTLTGLISGDIYPVLINTASMPTVTSGVMAAPTPIVSGAPSFAGNCRLTFDDGGGILDVNKGVKYGFSGTTQGPFSYSI